MNVLVVDVGGSHVKALATGQTVERRAVSGPTTTAAEMVDLIKPMVADWAYDVVSIGYPGVVVNNRPLHDPVNLGPGWVGFDFDAAFERRVKLLNDAAMQALGSYDGGRMLFLGLGTGLGSAMVVNGVVEPMEVAHLPYKKKQTYEDFAGERGLKRLGKKSWRKEVDAIVGLLQAALEPDYVVLGGGNVKFLKELPAGARLGNNATAFTGGFRMWEGMPEPATSVAPHPNEHEPAPEEIPEPDHPDQPADLATST